jgi:hypothetical protein
MPQLQKAIPVAAAPVKKLLRLVIGSSLGGRMTASLSARRSNRRPDLDFLCPTHCQAGSGRAIILEEVAAACPET